MTIVQFGLEGAHSAAVTENAGAYTFAEWVPIPGAVKLSGQDNSNVTEEYADNRLYFTVTRISSTDVDVEFEKLPAQFLIDYCGYVRSTTGGLIKTGNKKRKKLAFGFMNETDESGEYHVLPLCQVAANNMPSFETDNNGNVTFAHVTVTFKVTPVRIGKYDVIMDDIPEEDSRHANLWATAYTLPQIDED